MDLEPKVLRWSCALFGIYAMKKKRNNSNEHIQDNQCSLMQFAQTSYPYFILVLILTIFVYTMWTVNFKGDFLVSWLVATLVYSSQVMAHCVSVLESQVKAIEHEKFVCKMHNTAVMLKFRLKRDFCNQCFPRKLNQMFIGLSIFSIVSWILFITFVILLSDGGYFWNAIISLLTMRLRFLQLFVYLHILLKFIEAFNRKLQQIVIVTSSNSEKLLLDVDLQQLMSLEYMMSIKDMYTEIYECFAQYNAIGGWSRFSIVSCYFLDLTCQTYWLFLAMDKLLPPLYALASLCVLVPLCLLFCWFCHICQQCKSQGLLTSVLVQKLVNNNCSKTSLRYRNLIHDFSYQLQQQKIRITAREFYEFDKQLIMSIFVALATHLVILIQFLKDDQYTDNIFKT